MKMFEIGNKYNKLSSREELIDLLDKYKKVLNGEVVDYLNSLIFLEFSAIKNYISEDDMKILSELEIYRKIFIYNVYHKAINLLTDDDILIMNAYNKLIISKNDRFSNVKLFQFDYSNDSKGEILLHKSVYDENVRKDELNHILKTLEYLYGEENPYSSYDDIYGGPNSQWEYRHEEKIKKYEDKYNKLVNKKISLEEKKEIEITGKYNDILLEDYGLKEVDFKDRKNPFVYDSSKMNKILVKELPCVSLKNKIKYI